VAESEEELESSDPDGGPPPEEIGFVNRVMRHLELTEGVQIARRYLAMNAFDGALTMLGILLGGLITLGTADSNIVFNSILLASIGTIVAMAVSGFSGSYLTECAERDREVEELERAMLSDLSRSEYAAATRTTSVVVAIVDGLSPAIAASFIIVPLVLASFNLLTISIAFYAAILVCMLVLFVLGLFLGTVSRKNIWIYGAKTLFTGIVIALLMLTISYITGASV
jgi:predicted membrane protein (TIGR00267 family)